MKSNYLIISLGILIVLLIVLTIYNHRTINKHPPIEHFQDPVDGSLKVGRDNVPAFQELMDNSRYAEYDAELDPTKVDVETSDKTLTYDTSDIVGGYDDYIKTEDEYDNYKKTIIENITVLKPNQLTLTTSELPVNYIVKRNSAGVCESRESVPDEGQAIPVDFNTPRPANARPSLDVEIRAWYGWITTFIPSFTMNSPRVIQSRRQAGRGQVIIESYQDCSEFISQFFGLYDYLDLRPVNGETTGAGRRPNPNKPNILYMKMEQDNLFGPGSSVVRLPTNPNTFYVEGQNTIAYVPQFNYLERIRRTKNIPYKSARIVEAQYGRDDLWDTDLSQELQQKMKCGYILDLSNLTVYHTNLRMADPSRRRDKVLVILVRIGETITRYNIREYERGTILLPGPHITIGDTLLRTSLPAPVCDYTIRYSLVMWVRYQEKIDEPIVLFSQADYSKTPSIIFNELRLYSWGLSYILQTQDGQYSANVSLPEGIFTKWTHIAVLVDEDKVSIYVNRVFKGDYEMLAPAIWPFEDKIMIVSPIKASQIQYDPRLPILPPGIILRNPVINTLPPGVEVARFYMYPIVLPLDYLRFKFRTIN